MNIDKSFFWGVGGLTIKLYPVKGKQVRDIFELQRTAIFDGSKFQKNHSAIYWEALGFWYNCRESNESIVTRRINTSGIRDEFETSCTRSISEFDRTQRFFHSPNGWNSSSRENSVILDRIKKIKSYPLTLYIVSIVELEASNKTRALGARIAFRMPRETKFLSTVRLQRIEGNQPLFGDVEEKSVISSNNSIRKI